MSHFTPAVTAALGVVGTVCGTPLLMFAIIAVFIDTTADGRSGVVRAVALPHNSSATNRAVKLADVFILGPAGSEQ
jgi:hypothetical protein